MKSPSKARKVVLPKGWRKWRTVETAPIGSFAIIAARNTQVAIFSFNGVDNMPCEIHQYNTKAPTTRIKT